MLKKESVKKFLLRGIMISPSLINELQEKDTNEILESNFKGVLNKENIKKILVKNTNGEKVKTVFTNNVPKEQSSIATTAKNTGETAKKEKNEIKINLVRKYFKTKNKLTVNDFVQYYNNKLKKLKEILIENSELKNSLSINKATKGKNISLIGMIRDVEDDVITLEDSTGEIKILRKCGIEPSVTLKKDDVIGCLGKIEQEKFLPEKILLPEVKIKKDISRFSDDIEVLFVSDVCFGGEGFVVKKYNEFINWLKHQENLRTLFITGNLSDKKDYSFLNQIPKHIKVVLIPGGIDKNEILPMPAIEITNEQYFSLPNPSYLELEHDKEKITILLYHTEAITSEPQNSLLSMINKRHLSPSTFLPNTDIDPFLMELEPDIFHCGGFQEAYIGSYKGITLIATASFLKNPHGVLISLKDRTSKLVTF